MLILLTDGQQTYVPGVSEPSVSAKELAADGVDIFAIGIGQEIDQAELKSLISKPEHIFLSSDINTLIQELSGDISKALTCEGRFPVNKNLFKVRKITLELRSLNVVRTLFC